MPINSIGIAIDHRPPSGDRRIKAQEPSAETKADARQQAGRDVLRHASGQQRHRQHRRGQRQDGQAGRERVASWMTMNQIGR